MKKIYIVLSLIFLFGCKTEQEINDEKLTEFFKVVNNPFSHQITKMSEKELRDEAKLAQCDTLGLVKYMGRKDNFDYFVFSWNVGRNIYRIEVPNNVTKKPKSYSEKEEDWIIVGPHDLDSWLP